MTVGAALARVRSASLQPALTVCCMASQRFIACEHRTGALHWVVRSRKRHPGLVSKWLLLQRHDVRMPTTLDELPNAQDTRTEMLRLSARGYSVLRRLLVQLPDEKLDERGSTLGRMVTERRHRALQLYLLLLTCWPWLGTRKQPLPAAVWIRALTSSDSKAPTWSASTLSRAWKDLEELQLLEKRAREARAVRVVPRREDGKEAYEPPAGRRSREHLYFVLPDAFWKDELFAKLTLPGLAMLLIIAKETNSAKEMYLPLHMAQEWYGISAKTAQNGLNNLKEHGLLHVRKEPIKAPLSKTGWTTRYWYSLIGDYGTDARTALRKKARTERKARVGKAAPTPTKSRNKKGPARGTTAGLASGSEPSALTTTSAKKLKKKSAEGDTAAVSSEADKDAST